MLFNEFNSHAAVWNRIVFDPFTTIKKEILQMEFRSLVLKERGCYLFDLEHWIVRSGEMSQ